mmetsp:Transcript_21402/g.15328  ORF Transcript_21402/g.15328 Transcript_21402/m.15328 type:complete len:95 (+) Transcript_21402:362-646(+)
MRILIQKAMENPSDTKNSEISGEFRKITLKAAKATNNSDIVSPLLLHLDYQNTQYHLPALIQSPNLSTSAQSEKDLLMKLVDRIKIEFGQNGEK